MSAYDGMTDQQLMDLAEKIMLAAYAEEPQSIERAMKLAGHESVMHELKKRIAIRINAELGLPSIDGYL
jgi:hypothetical protein